MNLRQRLLQLMVYIATVSFAQIDFVHKFNVSKKDPNKNLFLFYS